MGAFDALQTDTFPYTHPYCAVALKLRLTDREAGQYKVAIVFKHKGKNFRPRLEFTIKAVRHQAGFGIVQLTPINNLVLLEAGKYTIELYLDKELISSLIFFAN
jgi:hypothetical protein